MLIKIKDIKISLNTTDLKNKHNNVIFCLHLAEINYIVNSTEGGGW